MRSFIHYLGVAICALLWLVLVVGTDFNLAVVGIGVLAALSINSSLAGQQERQHRLSRLHY